MPKRFTDTEIWNKEWFIELSQNDKLAIMYIKDKCDSVGVWTTNKKLAEFLIGGSPDWEKLPERCNGNIIILKNGKWFIHDFCEFQYGQLTESCPPHRRYIQLLKKYGLFEKVVKGYSKGIDTLQEKEKEKEEEKEEEKEKEGKKEYSTNVTLTEKEYQTLIKDFGKYYTDRALEKLSNAKGAKGYKYKSDYRAILNWVIKEVSKMDPVDLRNKTKAEEEPIPRHRGAGYG